jgi:putative membrane protein
MTRFAVVALGLAMLVTPALAQSNSNASMSAKKPTPMTEKFVKNATITDMFEIQAGKLAQDKANDSAYKDFAKMIIDDHTKTSEEMKAMQPKLGVQLPTELDAKHKTIAKKLESASGAAFENQFKAAQIDGHKAAVKLFEDYSKSGDNADLKQFAEKTLPTLKEHLQHAQNLPKGQAAPTTGSGSKMK